MGKNTPRVLDKNYEELTETCLHHLLDDCPKPEWNCAEDYDPSHMINNYFCDFYAPRLQIDKNKLGRRVECQCKLYGIILDTREKQEIETWTNIINLGLIDMTSGKVERLSLKKIVDDFVSHFRIEKSRETTIKTLKDYSTMIVIN